MKKFLRFLLIIILLLAVVVVVAGLLAPKEMNVMSSITINAPKEQVWEQTAKFKNYPNWSPWIKQDTQSKLSYAGNDGEPGSSYSWVSDKMGEGSMTNKSVENGQMNFELNFVKPFKGTADGYIKVEDSAGMTKVTHTFHSADGFMMRAMGYIMGSRKMLQTNYDEGLKNLKEYVESHKVETPAPAAMDIQEVQYTAHIYAGVRKVVKWEEMGTYFPLTYEAQAKAVGNRIVGPASAIYYTWDTVKHESDAFAGFPVAEDKPVAGSTIVKVAASKAYMVTYVGDPSKTMDVHNKIKAHADANKATVTMVLEEYVKSANEEKDMNKWVTNVYYLIK